MKAIIVRRETEKKAKPAKEEKPKPRPQTFLRVKSNIKVGFGLDTLP